MTKHTPGPWILRSAGELLNEIPHPFDFVEVSKQRYITTEGKSEREANANARLIAAAPDLLDMCERLLGFAHHYGDPWAVTAAGDGLLANAKALIAQAKGEG